MVSQGGWGEFDDVSRETSDFADECPRIGAMRRLPRAVCTEVLPTARRMIYIIFCKGYTKYSRVCAGAGHPPPPWEAGFRAFREDAKGGRLTGRPPLDSPSLDL